jgi:hypothetical protein
MTKLRIATGLGLVLLMATMIGGPVGVSPAQADDVTLADLAGRYAARGSGFLTLCRNAGLTGPQDCATAPNLVPINITEIWHSTQDTAGHICSVNISTQARVFGQNFPAFVNPHFDVWTINSFDPSTGSGTGSASQYVGGSCNGAAFNSTGATKVATFTFSFDVSDSGNRIELILTSSSPVGGAPRVVAGLVFSATVIRLQRQD